MAAVAPVFFLLIMGTFESARMGMAIQLLNVAAREGCRTAVLQGRTATDVQARVQQVLTGSGITAVTTTTSPATWQTAPAGTPITLTLAVPFSQLSWLGDPLKMGSVSVKASATLSSERDIY
jgi:Flp pilus assembly protein TadG